MFSCDVINGLMLKKEKEILKETISHLPPLGSILQKGGGGGISLLYRNKNKTGKGGKNSEQYLTYKKGHGGQGEKI